MVEREVFILAEKALADVIDAIGDHQWEWRKPGWFRTGGQGQASLREIVNYHAQDSAWVPDVLSGRTVAEVGDAHAGDLLGADPSGAYRRCSQAAVAAAAALDDPDRIVHLSYGDFPAREYLKHVTSFRGFRAFDIALWIGAPTELPEDLVQGMWEVLAPEMEAWRRMGVYGPAVPVPAHAPLQDRLLGLSGRDPWVVRSAEPGDADAAARLLHDFNTEFGDVTPGPERLAARIRELLAGGDTAVLLGGREPVGVAVLRFRPAIWTEALECHLAELYVVPGRRGRGLGRALLRAALELARTRGADRIDLSTSEADAAARHLYESIGFINREGGADGPVCFLYERDL